MINRRITRVGIFFFFFLNKCKCVTWSLPNPTNKGDDGEGVGMVLLVSFTSVTRANNHHRRIKTTLRGNRIKTTLWGNRIKNPLWENRIKNTLRGNKQKPKRFVSNKQSHMFQTTYSILSIIVCYHYIGSSTSFKHTVCL